jgi:hypothetical protein
VHGVIDNSLYYLVIHGRDENSIFIFIGADSPVDLESEQLVTPVTLELLPPTQRFGGTGGVAMGLPILGRWPGGISRFRQFLTVLEMEQAGWVPVLRYRICDSWEDYHSPWSFLNDDESTDY